MPSPRTAATLRATASGGGAVLSAATGAMGAVRRAAKPLHPRGEVCAGRLLRHGGADGGTPTGVPWLDEPGQDDVLVRRSRAVGLPPGWPDVHGLAVRVPTGAASYADLLLASTGTGRVTRFLLTASRSPTRRPMTTLLPYRSPTGPRLLLARAVGDGSRWELAHAVGRGPWQPFGELRLGEEVADALVSFDPVQHRLPGLEQYPAVIRLREPAYARARSTRR